MHELTVAKTLISKILDLIPRESPKKVRAVRLHKSLVFSEESIRQAFEALSKGTPLEGAQVLIERTAIPIHCSCGYVGEVGAEEQDGYPFVCPGCRDLLEIERRPDLELIEIVYGEPVVTGLPAGQAGLSAWCGATEKK